MNIEEIYNNILPIIRSRTRDQTDVENLRRLHQLLIELNNQIDNNDINISVKNIKIENTAEEIEKIECNICYENDCNIKSNCGHYYCEPCIKKWIMEKYKNTCPFCRTELETLKKYKVN